MLLNAPDDYKASLLEIVPTLTMAQRLELLDYLEEQYIQQTIGFAGEKMEDALVLLRRKYEKKKENILNNMADGMEKVNQDLKILLAKNKVK